MSDTLNAPTVQFPAIGFSADEVMAFDEMIELIAATATLGRQGRHIAMEVVDSAERHWKVTGLYRPESKKRAWWKFWPSLTVPQIEEEIDLEEAGDQSLIATRDRVRSIWEPRLDSDDGKLAALLAAAKVFPCRRGDIHR